MILKAPAAPGPTLATVLLTVAGRPANAVAGPVTALSVRSGTAVKVAVQLRLAAMVTWPSAQSASPLQPAKVEPVSAVAVSVTTVLMR